MRSIDATLKQIQAKKPDHGTYLCLAEAVTNRDFSIGHLAVRKVMS
jgi:hypothetical protein